MFVVLFNLRKVFDYQSNFSSFYIVLLTKYNFTFYKIQIFLKFEGSDLIIHNVVSFTTRNIYSYTV